MAFFSSLCSFSSTVYLTYNVWESEGFGGSHDKKAPRYANLPFSPSALHLLPISFFYNIFTTSTPVVCYSCFHTNVQDPAPCVLLPWCLVTLIARYSANSFTAPVQFMPPSPSIFHSRCRHPEKRWSKKTDALQPPLAYRTFFFMLFYFLSLPCTKNQILSEIHHFLRVCICVYHYLAIKLFFTR